MYSHHSQNDIYTLLRLRKVPFFIVFFIIVFSTYSILYAIDFIPEPVGTNATVQNTTATTSLETVKKPSVVAVSAPVVVASASVPLKIIFDKLNKTVSVRNPESRSIAVLDQALLSGAVRHPDSANFKNTGNIFLLGHSSYLPNVMNKNFQAFNAIQSLTWGDTIRLQSSDTEYIYRVEKVYEAKAVDVVVPQTPGKAMLTLATCNSFGTKDDRFIVEAVLVSSKPL